MAINLLNMEDYILQRIKEVAPDVNTDPGSAVRDTLVSPMVTILQPLANEIHRVKKSQSLLNSASLSEDDLDAILANIFVDREQGSKASGTATVYLRSPQATTLPRGTVFLGSGGLKFYSTTTVIKSPDNLTLNSSSGRYQFTVDVQASEPGEAYNLNIGEITGIISTDTNVVGATNTSAFSGGTLRESNSELLDRAKNSLGSRDLSTLRGAEDILKSNFAAIQKVNVVGFGDVDMVRDLLFAPSVTIDGIEYPEAEGVHLGGKIDIYTQVGLQANTVCYSNNPGSSYGLNRLAMYSSEGDANVLYEGTGICGTTVKPVVGITSLAIDAASRSLGLVNSDTVLTEGTDYVYISQSPGLSNSLREKKEIRFIRGSGTISEMSFNGQFLEGIDGAYYPLDSNEYGLSNITPDLRGENNLTLLGVSPSEIDSLTLFSSDSSVDGNRSLKIHPDQGIANSGISEERVVHVSTGYDSELTNNLLQLGGTTGFTVAGWFNLSSLPPGGIPGEVHHRTIMNMYGDVGDNLEDFRRVFDVYIDSEGKLHYNSRSDLLGDNENYSEEAIFSSYVDSENTLSNWVFLAFTYDSRGHKKEMFYATYADRELLDIDMANPTQNGNIGKLEGTNGAAHFTIGTADTDNSSKESFHGLIDSLQIYFEPLSRSDLASIAKNQNTATIFNVEDSTIVDALEPAMDGSIFGPLLKGGKLLMLSGAASGKEFDIIDSTDPFVLGEDGGNNLSLTLVSSGSTSIKKIKVGDRYALTPYPLSPNEGTSLTTNLDKDIVFTSSSTLSPNGEIQIGVGVDLSYDSGLNTQEIQDYVDLADTRPATADVLVKHTFPIYVGGSITIKTTQEIDEVELLVEVTRYIENIAVGGEFSIPSLVNHLFEANITGLQLPLSDITFDYRDNTFKAIAVTGLDDSFKAGESQFFTVRDLSVTKITS